MNVLEQLKYYQDNIRTIPIQDNNVVQIIEVKK